MAAITAIVQQHLPPTEPSLRAHGTGSVVLRLPEGASRAPRANTPVPAQMGAHMRSIQACAHNAQSVACGAPAGPAWPSALRRSSHGAALPRPTPLKPRGGPAWLQLQAALQRERGGPPCMMHPPGLHHEACAVRAARCVVSSPTPAIWGPLRARAPWQPTCAGAASFASFAKPGIPQSVLYLVCYGV